MQIKEYFCVCWCLNAMFQWILVTLPLSQSFRNRDALSDISLSSHIKSSIFIEEQIYRWDISALFTSFSLMMQQKTLSIHWYYLHYCNSLLSHTPLVIVTLFPLVLFHSLQLFSCNSGTLLITLTSLFSGTPLITVKFFSLVLPWLL